MAGPELDAQRDALIARITRTVEAHVELEPERADELRGHLGAIVAILMEAPVPMAVPGGERVN